jgi:hypothetical protein
VISCYPAVTHVFFTFWLVTDRAVCSGDQWEHMGHVAWGRHAGTVLSTSLVALSISMHADEYILTRMRTAPLLQDWMTSRSTLPRGLSGLGDGDDSDAVGATPPSEKSSPHSW